MAESRKFFHPESRRSREFQLAKTMMVLVLVFLILNSPRLVLGLIEVTQLSAVELCYEHNLDYHISKETYLLDFLARFLVIVNSSTNFLIYCLTGSQFRHQLVDMFHRVSGSPVHCREGRLRIAMGRKDNGRGYVPQEFRGGTSVTRNNR